MKYLMLCFMLLLTLASCKKEETQPELPPETTTGANTAGFIVNGKTVVVSKDSYSSVPGSGKIFGLAYQKGYEFDSLKRDYISIEISNSGETDVYSAYIRIDKLKDQTQTYLLGRSNGEYGSDGPSHPQIIVIHSSKNIDTQWYYSQENSGTITITRADFTQRIFSGNFECKLYNRFDETKTIQVTKGRFDINLRTLNK